MVIVGRGMWTTLMEKRDNQVKLNRDGTNGILTWIVNSVSNEIQLLILWNEIIREMWTVLEKMYGTKKRDVRVYSLMKDVYSHRQWEKPVSEFYHILKAKWEDLNYYTDERWKWLEHQAIYWPREWKNKIFIFQYCLNNEFESIRSQILNIRNLTSIKKFYAQVDVEEQRHSIMVGKESDGP